MSSEEHIQFLISQADEDKEVVDVLFKAGYYGHALFWAHLVLEKLCKALWISKNKSDRYPFIHNLLKILTDCHIDLNEAQIEFYSAMNHFQSKGRYPDTLHVIEKTVTKEVGEQYLDFLKQEISWLKEQMQ